MNKIKKVGVFSLCLAFAFSLFASAETNLSPRLVFSLPGVKNNPRNGEGDFVRLNDGGILFAYGKFTGANKWDETTATIMARVSYDGGETWSEDRQIIGKEGRLNVMCVSFLRLDEKRIAVFYMRKNSLSDCTPWMRITSDDFKTLSEPVCLLSKEDVDYYVCNNARAERLKSGRIIIPMARHSRKVDGDKRGYGRLSCVYSDDSGRTWKKGQEYVVYDEKGKRVYVQEPGVIELKDGRLYMYARTDRGRQWQMYSKDGGETWGDFGPSSIISPRGPATIERLKNGDLLLIWNDHDGRQYLRYSGPKWLAGMRAPLDIAISKDEGRTWIKRKTVETDEKGFYCYFAVIEMEDSLLLHYYNKPYLTGSCVTKVPLKWLYEGEGRTVTPLNYIDGEQSVVCAVKDKYHAWPTVTKLKSGELITVFSGDRVGHVCPSGKVQLVRSSDNGKTWTKPETIFSSDTVDCRDAGIQELKDGTLILNFFTSIAYYRSGSKAYAKYFKSRDKKKVADELGDWTMRSTDGGKTWTDKVRMPASLPHNVIELKDGRLAALGVRGRGWDAKYKHEQYLPKEPEFVFQTSSDGGRSWKIESVVPGFIGGLCEPHLIEMEDGALVGFVRYSTDAATDRVSLQTESYDGGKTWSKPHSNGPVGCPVHLIHPKDGRILATYAKRDKKIGGVYAAFSSDGGKTPWKDETLLYSWFAWDFGYPSSVQLDDGSILTVFYTPTKRFSKCIIKSIRWTPPVK
jgi:photosystem II stability/assembly factor-like uncharacterized protein